MGVSNEQPAEGFCDPIENYDPRKYTDAIERTLAEQNVESIQVSPYTCVRSDVSVGDAVRLMAERGVASVLVVDDGRLVGIFSDRDVLHRVAGNASEAMDAPLADYMTRSPIFVYKNESSGTALCVMALSGYRHVPVLGEHEEVLGVVSPQRVLDFLTTQLRER